ncbi:MAG TPA: DUF5916 domain-containing protein [Planctomycetota bacterium]|nr:DUF5916 domain-containing protein [Planctomycetota bacterium]
MIVPILLALACPRGAAPQNPSAQVARTAKAPRIDGVLEAEVWSTAPSIGPLTQVEPHVGELATEATDVRILYDAQNLYLGIRCFDREPGKIVATQPSRDAELDPDDRVELVIDTFRDRRNAFYFQMSPAGSKGDALISGDGSDYNKPWDGIWDGKAAIDAEGWVAEIAIPFKTLSFAAGATTWGFNINRVIKRRNETDRWASPTLDAQVFQISRAGDLTGFSGIEQGFGVDVVPFAVARWSRDRRTSGQDEDFIGHGGADVFYKLTSNLTASLTLDTDFAETEVDQRQVNLTRFPLFFPEKRDFFLENAGIFKFADLGTELIPFFSRRIGLSPTGEEIPILAGAKLTGRQDDWNIGVLDVQTEEAHGIDDDNFFVARVSKNVGEQWNVGTIVTHGDPAASSDNLLYGADANWRTNDGIGGKRTSASVWYLGSDTEGAPGDDSAAGASLSYPNDLWKWRLGAKQIDENFQPALGFVPRRGVRIYDGQAYYSPRIGGAVRQLSFGVADRLFTDLDDHVETHDVDALLFGVEFESGDELRFLLEETREVLEQPFDITPAVTVPIGTYDDSGLRVEVETGLQRPISLLGAVTVGEFLGGDSVRWSSALEVRPDPLVTSALEWEQSNIAFDAGDVEAQVARMRVNFNFTPDLSWNNFVQWDSQSDEFGLHSRWRWIPTPGQEFFLVFNQTEEDTTSLHPAVQQVAFKASYTIRF